MTDRINEALARLQEQGFLYLGVNTPIAEAARAYVQDWITCPTCEGDWQSYPALTRQLCPDCVDGLIPSPEALECAAAAAHQWVINGDPIPFAAEDAISQDIYRDLALAVLVASRRGDTHATS